MVYRLSVDELVIEARGQISNRVSVSSVQQASASGALLVDIRGADQQQRDGCLPGAIPVARNVLEWRCEPNGTYADTRLNDPAGRLVLVCDEGFQSSLAAATLVRIGLPLTTDLIGGFQAWRAAGLPICAS